jgi:MFS family permease
MVWIVDRFGRRTALFIGGIGSMVAMYYLAAYSAISGSFTRTPPSDDGSRTALAMIYLYAIFFGFSWNGIPWILASEVLPNQIRDLSMMFAVCMQYLAQFMVVYSVPYMMTRIQWGTFVFFGTCTFVSIFIAFLFVPETKGVSLEDMDICLRPEHQFLRVPHENTTRRPRTLVLMS